MTSEEALRKANEILERADLYIGDTEDTNAALALTTLQMAIRELINLLTDLTQD